MENNDLLNSKANKTNIKAASNAELVLSSGNISEEITFEEAVSVLTETINRAPLHREIFLRILNFCKHQRSLGETEEAITSYPEFASVIQSPYRLIRTLANAGGLHWLELDEQGIPLTPQAKIELSPDEIDELTFSYAVVTTSVGEQAADDLAPEKRLRKLFDSIPQRLSTYLDIMDFCHENRSFKEIDALLRSRSSIDFVSVTSGQSLQPSFFVDALERAGGLVWNDGWKTTERGLHILKEFH